jgi:hypothetical protein
MGSIAKQRKLQGLGRVRLGEANGANLGSSII